MISLGSHGAGTTMLCDFAAASDRPPVCRLVAPVIGSPERDDLQQDRGNGLNHPNDFGHRIYSEVILELMSP